MILPEDGLETLMLLYNRRTRDSKVRPAVDLAVDLCAHRKREGVEPPLAALETLGLVLPEGEGWRMTANGIDEARAGWRALSIQGFDEALVRNFNSATYRRYCERVFETGLHQLNMVDRVQLERALERMAVAAGDRFADLGCGVGAITEHVRQRTGAAGHGIDFAPTAIQAASTRCAPDPLLTFAVGDLNTLTLDAGTYDAVVFFDTLYFVDDVTVTLKSALNALKPGGRLVAFYSVHRTADAPVESVEAGNGPVARALDTLGIRWDAEEFTAEEHALWRRARVACAELKDAFEAEDVLKAWSSRDSESEKQVGEFDAGLARRWLYVASVPAS